MLLGIGTMFISLLFYTFETLLIFIIVYLISLPVSFFIYQKQINRENIETSEEDHEDVL